ncbi:MAG TPA: SPOR domain-containing protein [Acidobacteriota bacterium]|nr:SPOR domain-containing protein [Acidobacteriota bacterium]
MKPAMTQQRAFALFGLVLGATFAFFLMGLWIGKNHLAADSGAQISELAEQPLEDVRPLLDFYGEFAESEAEPKDRVPSAESQPKADPPAAIREVEPPPPPVVEEEARPAPASAVEESEDLQGEDAYTIQVGAYSSEREARELLSRLQTFHIVARIQSPQPGGPDSYYRVRVGRFGSAAEARTMEAELKEKGFPTFVTRVE